MNKKSVFFWLFAFCISLPVFATGLVGKVVSVADGDTVTVLDADKVQHKIRLSGIDAPERAQAFGNRSREYLASMVAGQQVAVETDKTDRFGRSVGKVLLQGRDVNLAMVASGLAWHYKKYQREQSASDWMCCTRVPSRKHESSVLACGEILSQWHLGTGGRRNVAGRPRRANL